MNPAPDCCVRGDPHMPTACHLIVGTDHPFAHALTAALQRTYGEDAVQAAADTKVLSSLASCPEVECIYLLSGVFPTATTEPPSAIRHRSTRELLAVLDFA